MLESTGNTPLVEMEYLNLNGNRVFAKAEFMNPAGSIKDRIAKEMILSAIDRGEIKDDTIIIEATSGNTGIGLAGVCASLGLKLIIIMPESMSIERRKIISHYGAKLILTPASGGMKATLEKLEELKKDYPNHYLPMQFSNPDNPKAHYKTTAPEIYAQTEGNIDIFIAGVGTGGTITGVGRYLKEKNPNIQIIALEPENSPFLSKGEAGSHSIQGIGAGFKPEILDMSVIDDIITISDEEAFLNARECAIKSGLAVGISAGANLAGVKKILKNSKNKRVVTVLPDGANRYLSTQLFE